MKARPLFAANNAMLAALVLAGLAFRLASMGGSLWYDEAFSAWLVQLPFSRMIAATLGDVHPPAFYSLLWLTVAALGDSELVLRLPSLISGVLLIPVAYRLAQRLNLSQAQWGVVGLVSLAPFMVYYSTEARSYAMQMLAVALAALGLIERRHWLLVMGALAALYLQHTAALAVAALFVAVWGQMERRRWLVCAGLVAIGYLPGLLVLITQARAVGAGYWILPVNHVGRLADVLDNLLWWLPYNPLPVTGLVTGLAVVLVLADGRRLWAEQRLAVIVAAGPLFLAVLASLMWQPILIARILAPSALFYYLLIADVATRSRPRALWWGLAAGCALVINGSLVTGSGGRPADLYTIPGYRPGDGIYHLNAGTYIPWHYYDAGADQWLFLQDNTLATNVSAASKAAMGFQQASLSDVQCLHPRWWIITMDNPTSTPAELHYSAFLKEISTAVTPLRNDVLVNSQILLFEPKCIYSGL